MSVQLNGSLLANMATSRVFVLLLLANIFVILSVSAVPKKKEVFCWSTFKDTFGFRALFDGLALPTEGDSGRRHVANKHTHTHTDDLLANHINT